jgi:Mg/Co/Ni transporter MgtE
MDPDVRVAEIMRIDIPQVYEYTKVSEVLSLIKNYSVIPVTDYQQKLLGAVTRSNVIDSYQKYITREQVIS